MVVAYRWVCNKSKYLITCNIILKRVECAKCATVCNKPDLPSFIFWTSLLTQTLYYCYGRVMYYKHIQANLTGTNECEAFVRLKDSTTNNVMQFGRKFISFDFERGKKCRKHGQKKKVKLEKMWYIIPLQPRLLDDFRNKSIIVATYAEVYSKI